MRNMKYDEIIMLDDLVSTYVQNSFLFKEGLTSKEIEQYMVYDLRHVMRCMNLGSFLAIGEALMQLEWERRVEP